MRFLSHAITLLCFSSLGGSSSPLHAMQSGDITGVVGDTAQLPIADVQVMLHALAMRVVTDARGRFRFRNIKPGTYDLSVQRIGYEPLTFAVDVRDRDSLSLDVQLNAATTNIAPMVVRENAISRHLIDVGFEERRRSTNAPPSQFITRAEIAKRNPIDLTQLISRMSGRLKECAAPIVYVDGSLRPALPRDPPMITSSPKEAARVGDPPPRPRVTDGIPPDLVDGMELYIGPAQIPLQYKAAWRGGDCLVLIWTR